MSQGTKKDFERCGFTKVNRQGQMLVPSDARKALALDPETSLIVFVDRKQRRLIVGITPPDEDLLDLTTRAATASDNAKK